MNIHFMPLKYAVLAVLLMLQAMASGAASQTDVQDKGSFYGVTSPQPATRWEEGLLTGNGRMGAIVYGHPLEETIVINHWQLYCPAGPRIILPDLSDFAGELKAVGLERDPKAVDEFIQQQLRKRPLQWDGESAFHPAFVLKLRMNNRSSVSNYVGSENFLNGEIGVNWSDAAGNWSRRLFASRPDNVVALNLSGPKGKLDCELEIEIDHPLIRTEFDAIQEWVTGRSIYVKGRGGYDFVLRSQSTGGIIQAQKNRILIKGADEATIYIRVERWKMPVSESQSEAWAFSPKNPDFVNSARTNTIPDCKDSLKRLADYDSLLKKHAAVHGELFGRVSLDLSGRSSHSENVERLLEQSRKTGRLSPALVERMYDAARYLMICSAGDAAPSQSGIWNGSWIPSGNSGYSMDESGSLSLSSLASSRIPELMNGWFQFAESWLPDCRTNARKIYGARGLAANISATDNALLTWVGWGGEMYLGAAGWLLGHSYYEYYQHTGDREFLATRCVPLLKEIAFFYEDILKDTEGPNDKYRFWLCYSPLLPKSMQRFQNATLELGVARETLSNLIAACEELQVEQDNIPRWKAMLNKIPPYLVGKDGAIKEWSSASFENSPENYNHRHYSLLYPLCQSYEWNPYDNNPFWQASQAALDKKAGHWLHNPNADSDHISHGLLNHAQCAARLGRGEAVFEVFSRLATNHYLLPSMAFASNPDRKGFSFDASGGLPDVIHKSLVFCNKGNMELLASLPPQWSRGSIRGMLARSQVQVNELTWNMAEGKLRLVATSGRDQRFTLRLGASRPIQAATIKSGQGSVASISGQPALRTLTLSRGSTVTLDISFPASAESAMDPIPDEPPAVTVVSNEPPKSPVKAWAGVTNSIELPPARTPASSLGVSELDNEKINTFLTGRLGIGLYWGLYSGPGRGEMMMMNEGTSPAQYARLAHPESGMDFFAADKFDANAWAQLAQDSGVKWMTLMARNEDGYSLFNSPHTNAFTSFQTHKRDFAAEFADACRKAGLKVGFGLALPNWRYPGCFDVTGSNCLINTWGYKSDPAHLMNARLMKEENYAALKQLLSAYGKIDYLRFYGHNPGLDSTTMAKFHEPGLQGDPSGLWPVPTPWTDYLEDPHRPMGLMGLVRKYQPQTLTTPWAGWIGDVVEQEGASITGAVRTAQNIVNIVPVQEGGPGYNQRAIDNSKVLSHDEIARLLSACATRNMSLMLAAGPDRHGEIPSLVRERLRATGAWLKRVGEAFYGTQGGPWNPEEGQYGFTYRNDILYVHILKEFTGVTLPIPPVGRLKPIKAWNVLDKTPIVAVKGPECTITLAGIDRTQMPAVTIVAIQFDKPIMTYAKGDLWKDVDDSHESIAYQGGWDVIQRKLPQASSEHYSVDANASATFHFNGTGVRLLGPKRNDLGTAEILLDGISKGVVDQYSPLPRTANVLFELIELERGPHTLTLKLTGGKNNASQGWQVVCSGFQVCGEPSTPPAPKVSDVLPANLPAFAPKVDPSSVLKWQGQRLGLMICWGPASLKGVESGWARGDAVPIDAYDKLFQQFNPSRFNPAEWVTIAKDAGMKHLVFTAKTRDGFCMWDTRQTDYNIMRTPVRRDLTRELAAACKNAALPLSLYYSIADWKNPSYPWGGKLGKDRNPKASTPKYLDYMIQQTCELTTNYGPLQSLWFDAPGELSKPYTVAALARLRGLQSDILVNDRIGHDLGDYRDFDLRIGDIDLEHAWESVFPLGTNYFWKPEDRPKSFATCIQTLARTAGNDGNLLVALGPRADGSFDPLMITRLRDIGQWMKKYGESITETRGGPYKSGRWGASTRKGNKVYLHVFDWQDGDSLVLPALPHKFHVTSAKALTGGTVEATNAAVLSLHLRNPNRLLPSSIIELTLDQPAMGLPILSPIQGRVISLGARATATDVAPPSTFLGNTTDFGALNAIDDNEQTRWATETPVASLTVDLGAPRTFCMVEALESLDHSNVIQRFEISYKEGESWRQLAQGSNFGPSCTFRHVFTPVTAQFIRLNIMEARTGIAIDEMRILTDPGPYQVEWDSLASHPCPAWFRDAKFGIQPRWSADSVPMVDGRYGRLLYQAEHADVGEGAVYEYHVKKFGHPTQFGYKDLIPLWTGDKWDPSLLCALFKKVGAQYVMPVACGLDNIDCFDSSQQPWNSLRAGPKRNIVAEWKKAIDAQGLRFGLVTRSYGAWSFYEPAFGFDSKGKFKGVSYDATQFMSEGKDRWWNGTDPRLLYTRPHASGAEPDPAFMENCLARNMEVIVNATPDLLLVEGAGKTLPNLLATHYNTSLLHHSGRDESVAIVKPGITNRAALVEIDRPGSVGLLPDPWQTTLSIAPAWPVKGATPASAATIIHTLVDVISKNGNLLLEVGLRADGTLPTDQQKILEEVGRWLDVNSEAVYGSRPWTLFGEGPSAAPAATARDIKRSLNEEDIRFTMKQNALYVIVPGWPGSKLVIKSLNENTTGFDSITDIQMLGVSESLKWTQNAKALTIQTGKTKSSAPAVVFKITCNVTGAKQ